MTSTAGKSPSGLQTRVHGYATHAQGLALGAAEIDCDRPLLVMTSRDGRPWELSLWRCSNTRQSKCVSCSHRYRLRVQAVAADGLFSPSSKFYLLTLTAPGDVEHCKKKDCDRAPHCGHELCRCTPPGGVDLARWNPTCGRRWNSLLKLIEDHYGARPTYFRAVEVQDGKRREDAAGRGALHLHVLVRSDYVMSDRTLRKLAVDAGFGHSLTLDELAPGSRKAAHYVSKYVSKSCDMRDDVPWLVEDLDPVTGETIEKTVPTFRTWSQSRAWGKSMRELRLIARQKWDSTHPPAVALVLVDLAPAGTPDPPAD